MASETAARMRERGGDALTITTPDGALVGLLRREDAERALQFVRHLGTRPGNLSSPNRWQTSFSRS
jgi:hypothetical protein